MLARVYIQLPFSIVVPEGVKFKLYEYVEQGYTIRLYPPKRSEQTRQTEEELSVNGNSALQADVLHINFYKNTFDRSKGVFCDPPADLIRSVANSFLIRLRIVTRSHIIRPIDFPNVSWNLQYLNDDESELEGNPELVRGRWARKFTFSWTALTPEIWEDIHSLQADFVPPHWDTLLLDTKAAMPDVGLSIVLAATALEVFISDLLNKLAARSPVPPEIWAWINSRSWWLKNPDIEEQFDKLLKMMGDFSLKDEKGLWKAFINLKKARNSFVHEGEAQIGSKPISEDVARKLIAKAGEIVAYIKEKMPQEVQWPEFKHTTKFSAKHNLLRLIQGDKAKDKEEGEVKLDG
ncbi:MAG: hypothetical protein KAV87_36015 [Desulfobacteraceae bacterium]|nr:hypothetical protein [Desulfobacteraceae bacterium]